MGTRASSDGEAPRLRVGVLAGSDQLAAWQRETLERLVEGDDVDLVALVTERSRSGTGSRWRRVLSNRGLWRLYNNLWVARRSRAVRPTDCSDLFSGATRLAVRPELVGRYSQHFPDDAIRQLRELDLDVLLRFGFGIVRGEVLAVARYGIWSFHHDDERVIRGGPPSFWEVAEGLATTGVLLQRLTERLDAGIPLARATFRTVSYSYPRNRDRAAFGAAALPARVASAGSLRGRERRRTPRRFRGRTDPTRPDECGDGAVRRSAGSPFGRREASARSSSEPAGPSASPISPSPVRSPTATSFEWLPERQGGYDADPFPVEHRGRHALLVEEFDERSGKGTISALSRDASGGWRRDRGVIDPQVHASYPFPVQVGDDLYCVPETAQAGRVDGVAVHSATGPVGARTHAHRSLGGRSDTADVERSLVAVRNTKGSRPECRAVAVVGTRLLRTLGTSPAESGEDRCHQRPSGGYAVRTRRRALPAGAGLLAGLRRFDRHQQGRSPRRGRLRGARRRTLSISAPIGTPTATITWRSVPGSSRSTPSAGSSTSIEAAASSSLA